VALARGFKAEAERIVQELRRELGAPIDKSLDPYQIAEHLGIEVVPADELVSKESLKQLASLQPGAFSACTFKPSQDRTIIVYNPLHSAARRKSDIAHELAHIILDHALTRLERVSSVSFFVCDARQEEEAGWFSGCLLLPRMLLLSSLRRGLSPAEIAKRHEVSEPMVVYRINVTGIRRQLESGAPAKGVIVGSG